MPSFGAKCHSLRDKWLKLRRGKMDVIDDHNNDNNMKNGYDDYSNNVRNVNKAQSL